MNRNEDAYKATRAVNGRRRFVTVYYCVVGHEHRTEAAAEKCSRNAMRGARREIESGWPSK